ncbi:MULTISPECIES: SGNH/GDSL hydrolase family protein [Aerosakkonema]|uniref:SGNH/GDSL hydrolase family protein n=1 Tax=Aerosakkonema TaxID=1246629 RepID=UPI0035BB79C7
MQNSQRLFSLGLILCLVVLIGSVVLNFSLFFAARHYYILLNQIRLDPLGLQDFRAKSSQRDVSNTATANVVFFGDSRSKEWPFPSGLKGFSFANRGITGQTSSQVLERFDKHVLPLRPKIVVVQVGINDLKTIPLFPRQKDRIVANCKDNIEEIVKRSRSLGATVILTTIFPVGDVPLTRKPFWSSEVDRAILELNSYIYSLQAPNVIILDSYSLLAENGKNKYQRDTLHTNAKGYQILNQELTKVLARLTL